MKVTREERNTLIATGVGLLTILGVAFEIAGFNTPWWHSISYYAHANPILRWGIAGLIVVTFVWWIWHSGHPIPKLIRRFMLWSNY